MEGLRSSMTVYGLATRNSKVFGSVLLSMNAVVFMLRRFLKNLNLFLIFVSVFLLTWTARERRPF